MVQFKQQNEKYHIYDYQPQLNGNALNDPTVVALKVLQDHDKMMNNGLAHADIYYFFTWTLYLKTDVENEVE